MAGNCRQSGRWKIRGSFEPFTRHYPFLVGPRRIQERAKGEGKAVLKPRERDLDPCYVQYFLRRLYPHPLKLYLAQSFLESRAATTTTTQPPSVLLSRKAARIQTESNEALVTVEGELNSPNSRYRQSYCLFQKSTPVSGNLRNNAVTLAVQDGLRMSVIFL